MDTAAYLRHERQDDKTPGVRTSNSGGIKTTLFLWADCAASRVRVEQRYTLTRESQQEAGRWIDGVNLCTKLQLKLQDPATIRHKQDTSSLQYMLKDGGNMSLWNNILLAGIS